MKRFFSPLRLLATRHACPELQQGRRACPEQGRRAPLATLFLLLTACCSLITIAGCSACDKDGDDRAGAGKFQQGGRYERSDEDLEKLPEKDPRRLEPQPHFKKFRPEEEGRSTP